MTVELKPKDGWKQIEINLDVSDYLYSQYNQVLKNAGWKYLNFTSDTAIFEAPNGNTVYLEFSKSDKGNHDLIKKMVFNYSNTNDSFIQNLEYHLINEFQVELVIGKI